MVMTQIDDDLCVRNLDLDNILLNSFCIFYHSFMSRCIFKINPEKGSKVERLEKKKSNAVNPKILTLINRIAEYEWST